MTSFFGCIFYVEPFKSSQSPVDTVSFKSLLLLMLATVAVQLFPFLLQSTAPSPELFLFCFCRYKVQRSNCSRLELCLHDLASCPLNRAWICLLGKRTCCVLWFPGQQHWRFKRSSDQFTGDLCEVREKATTVYVTCSALDSHSCPFSHSFK